MSDISVTTQVHQIRPSWVVRQHLPPALCTGRLQLYTPEELTPEEETLIKRLGEIQVAPVQRRPKGFWSKVKESLGA